jgi:MoxR-like ATPase
VFANVLLADEINRTPPKTQAALLEAMQERRVTVQGRTYELDKPFFVFATQNPIELEGTYPLPEAQLDRFMLEVMLDYLPEEDEVNAVVKATTALPPEAVQPVVSKDEILAFQRVVRRLPIADAVTRYAVKLVRCTRPTEPGRRTT